MEKFFYFLKMANKQIHFSNNRGGLYNMQQGYSLSYPEWLILYPEESYILAQLLEEFGINLDK